jgi:hypothetical protein
VCPYAVVMLATAFLQLRYEVHFSNPRISKPAVREADVAAGSELDGLSPLFPAEARLRNLT